MIRRAFVRRMAVAALASGLLGDELLRRIETIGTRNPVVYSADVAGFKVRGIALVAEDGIFIAGEPWYVVRQSFDPPVALGVDDRIETRFFVGDPEGEYLVTRGGALIASGRIVPEEEEA